MIEEYVAFQKVGGVSDRALVKLEHLFILQKSLFNDTKDEQFCSWCGSKMIDERCPWCRNDSNNPRFSEAAEVENE